MPVDGQRDGSNQFIYSRFLVPYLQSFIGWAIYADGDMVCLDDISKLWELKNEYKSVMVVKHDYKTKFPVKYLGSKNEDYPRKNWSSLILWNCASHPNRRLTPAFINEKAGSFLHRFEWVPEDRIGQLPMYWNWLVGEYGMNSDAKLVHYTVGAPCFKEYRDGDYSKEWHQINKELNSPL